MQDHQNIGQRNIFDMVKPNYRDCIKVCQECALACEMCLEAMIGEDSSNDCPLCCYECLQACQQCVSAMARNSQYAKDYCRLCANICDWCAIECGQHQDMEVCQKCALSCYECAKECWKMVH